MECPSYNTQHTACSDAAKEQEKNQRPGHRNPLSARAVIPEVMFSFVYAAIVTVLLARLKYQHCSIHPAHPLFCSPHIHHHLDTLHSKALRNLRMDACSIHTSGSCRIAATQPCVAHNTALFHNSLSCCMQQTPDHPLMPQHSGCNKGSDTH